MISKSDTEWRAMLVPEQYRILREEGTEAPFSSSMNDEKGIGVFVCAGCDAELFTSDMKFDSGSGWPSFFTAIHENIETKVDNGLIYARTEYHCSKCGGHQGHVFNDGPQPTGQRWCNNGLALRFVAKPDESM
jgi:peptide-methionine (R)-S-oxide reductase